MRNPCRSSFLLLILISIFISGCVSEARKSPDPVPVKAEQLKEPPKERVTGIGGVFFKARDPKGMAAWYAEHLGIQSDHGFADFTWREQANPNQIGHTAWAIFPTNTTYFGKSSSSPLMINYRVGNLERLLEQLRREGVTIEKVENADFGRFARIVDPEGNRIELWEPK